MAESADDYSALVDRLAETVGSALGGACVVRVHRLDGVLDGGSGWYPGGGDESAELGHLVTSVQSGVATEYAAGLDGARWVSGARNVAMRCPREYWPLLDRLDPVGATFSSLRARGRTIGVLVVALPRETGGAEPQFVTDLEMVELVAQQVALALDNAALLEGARRELADRRRAEAQLTASEQRFRSAFRDSPAGVLLLDLDGRITELNGAASRLVGCGEKEAGGEPFTSALSAASAAAASEALEDLGRGRARRRELELTYVSCEKRSREALTTISAAREALSYAFVVHAVDITPERMAAEENRMLNELLMSQLEQLSEARTSLASALAEVAALREMDRRQLSHSLHENTLQTLMAVTWAFDDLRAHLGDTEQLNRARDLLDGAVSSLRAISASLLPPALDGAGLAAALAEQLDRLAATTGAEVSFVVGGQLLRFARDREALAFRVGAEALSAALGRESVERVKVRADVHDHRLRLDVSVDAAGTANGSAQGLDVDSTFLAFAEMVTSAGGRLRRVEGAVSLDLPLLGDQPE